MIEANRDNLEPNMHVIVSSLLILFGDSLEESDINITGASIPSHREKGKKAGI